MPQDAFTIRLISRELDETLRGGKINKINQPAKEELSFIIYTGKRTVKLTINANAAECGVYFSEDAQENPLVAPNFCMLLRKHLSGAEILSVFTPGFERILVFKIKCFSEFSVCERELHVEIMGKYSNVILTENDVILGAMKTTALDEQCKRIILSGVRYALPASQDKINPADERELAALFAVPPEGDLARFLFTRVAGLAPCTAEQIVRSYRSGDFAKHVYDYIFSDDISPRVTESNGAVVDFFARANEGIPFDTLSRAQSYYYAKKRAERRTGTLRRKLLSAVNGAVKKHEKRLAQILEKQTECGGAELNRIKGELITANLYRLQRGMKSCALQNYYDGKELKIQLDESLSPSENAQLYYKRYRKQKRTLEILQPQEKEIRAELDYAQSLVSAIVSAETDEDLKCAEEELIQAGFLKEPKEKSRRIKSEIPFRAYECAGFQIYAGRNNLQNDRLLRASSPDDVWLHAQKYHSCHVIVKSGGKQVPEEALLFAAAVCAKYSDGKGDKIPVDYCPVKNVKKPPKSKAGFVIYSGYKTIYAAPETNRS